MFMQYCPFHPLLRPTDQPTNPAHLRAVFCITLVSFLISFGHAAASTATPKVGAVESIDSIDATIEQRDILLYDPTRRSLMPEFYRTFRSWREDTAKKFNLEGIFSYDTLTQGYIGGGHDEIGSSGDLSVSTQWLVLGHKYTRPVYLAFRIRHRHPYGNTAPSEISHETGLLWKTVDGFTAKGLEIPDLNLYQQLASGRLTLRYGQFSIDNFFDNHKLRSAKRYFLNQIFSANPAVGFPSYGAGFVSSWQDSNNWDFSLGISNIQVQEQREAVSLGFDSTANFFAGQAGYNFESIGSRDARIQLMLWNSSGEEELPYGNGASLTLEHAGPRSGERYVARIAFSSGRASPLDQAYFIGWGREIRKFDHYGIGLGAGRSGQDGDQWESIVEIYYRWQATKELIISPDLQVIVGEDSSTKENFQIVTGLRAGFNF
ncbi:MAG: carbohydrate porin [Thermodesulfobacteriota bacterium]